MAKIYMVARGQVKTRFNGESDVVTDLDFVALDKTMDWYGIQYKRETFARVRAVFFHFLNKDKE